MQLRLFAAEATAGASAAVEVSMLLGSVGLLLGAISLFIIKVLPALRGPKSARAAAVLEGRNSAADHIDHAITELRAAAESCRSTETTLQAMLQQRFDEFGERIERRFDRHEERISRQMERQDERRDELP